IPAAHHSPRASGHKSVFGSRIGFSVEAEQHALTMNKKLNSMTGRPGVLAHGCRVENTRHNTGVPRLQIVTHPDGGPCTPRLPGYDTGTRRLEMSAFCLLGSIAVSLVLLAAGNAARFSENRDGIAAALSSGATVETAKSATQETNHVLTNVTAAPTVGRG